MRSERSRGRRPPRSQVPCPPPGRGRARRAPGARGGAGGGGQCETGWCCCARACSGPRCISGCGCAPRRPRAPPPSTPQVRAGPGGAGRGQQSGGRPHGWPFPPRALKSGRLEGARVCGRPAAVTSPRSRRAPAAPAAASPAAAPGRPASPACPGAEPRVSASRQRFGPPGLVLPPRGAGLVRLRPSSCAVGYVCARVKKWPGFAFKE